MVHHRWHTYSADLVIFGKRENNSPRPCLTGLFIDYKFASIRLVPSCPCLQLILGFNSSSVLKKMLHQVVVISYKVAHSKCKKFSDTQATASHQCCGKGEHAVACR